MASLVNTTDLSDTITGLVPLIVTIVVIGFILGLFAGLKRNVKL